ncbi:MAG: TIGR00296 family protein [Thermoplasmatota archaeon]|nr:TIGR00296 family protein [Candidatus Thermoplasmatota archaeon]MBU1915193.1 TIGR00296 family protein [Candidatus Thermoplasmatota archaeon]
MMFSDEDGRLAVKIARAAVESHVRRTKFEEPKVPDIFKKNYGVFVTLTTYPDDQLRGCIGYPEPVMPLINALKDAAISACSRDPRFPEVKPEELKRIRVEASLLTEPEEVKVKKPREYISCVKIGEDGLIMQRGYARGLLLPQVPVEWHWDAEEFLCQCCLKAGLMPDSWLQEGTKIFKFQAEVFSEDKPGEDVRRRSLSDEHGSCSGR